MIFQPALARKVLAGEKSVTRRVMSANPSSPWFSGGCAYGPDSVCAVQTGRGKPSIGRIRVLRVDEERLGQVSDEEALREGFAGLSEFIQAWRGIHDGEWDLATRVWRVEFELA